MKTITMLVFFVLAGLNGYSQEAFDSDEKLKDVILYPNPIKTGDKFIIKSETTIASVEVLNVIGKIIDRTENNEFTQKEVSIQLEQCEKGMYFVKIIFEDKKYTIKKLLVK